MRRLSMESRTGLSKGWPFRVVVAMMGFCLLLKFGGSYLLCGLVVVNCRPANRGKSFCSVKVEEEEVERPKL